MAARQKQDNGITSQKIANVTMLKWIFMMVGEIKKITAQIRITAL